MTTISGIENSYKNLRETFGNLEIDRTAWIWEPQSKRLTFSTELFVEEDQYENYTETFFKGLIE